MPTTNTPHKATLRRYDGENWNPVYLATTADIVQIGEPLTVMGPGHGIYADGENIPANEPVATIIKKLIQTRVLPEYKKPTLELVVNNVDVDTSVEEPIVGSYEIGESVEIDVTSTFTQNDAGPLDGGSTDAHMIYMVTSNGSTNLASGDTGTLTVKNAIALTANAELRSSASYAAGEIKQDNFGDDAVDDVIPAGSLVSVTYHYLVARAMFAGADALGVNTPRATSAEIRALGKYFYNDIKSGVELAVPAGSTRVTFAAPNGTTDYVPKRVEYVESGNANVVDQFSTTSVNVEGANGYAAIAYDVYTLAWDQPTSGAMTLRFVFTEPAPPPLMSAEPTNVKIDYQNETLTGFDAAGTYTINGQAVSPVNGSVDVTNYMGETVNIVRLGESEGKLDSAAQTINVPTRPEAPDISSMRITKTQNSVKIDNPEDYQGCEYDVVQQ